MDFRIRYLAVLSALLTWVGTTHSQSVEATGYWDGRMHRTSQAEHITLGIDAAGKFVSAGSLRIVDQNQFTQVLRWDGRTWEVLTRGVATAIRAHDGVTWLAGVPNSSFVLGIRTGQEPIQLPAVTGTISALASDPGGLVAGGAFVAGNGSTATNVARWKDGEWQPLGNGVPAAVTCLLSNGGVLYAGTAATLNDPAAVWRWDNNGWEVLGAIPGEGSPVVKDLAWHDGRVVAAVSNPASANTSVLSWDGSTWVAHGDLAIPGSANALAVYRGDLYAAGSFLALEGSPARTGLVRLSGGHWTPVLLEGALPFGICTKLAASTDALFVLAGMTSAVGLGSIGVQSLWQLDGDRWNFFSNSLTMFTEIDGMADSPAGMVMTSLSLIPASTPGYGGWLWDGAYMKPLAFPSPANSTVRMRPMVVGHRGRVFRHAALVAPDAGGPTVLLELQGRTWTVATPSCPVVPAALASHGDAVLVAGADTASPVGAAAVMAWRNGRWERVGPNFMLEGGGGGTLSAVISHRSRLLAAGNFHEIGGKPVRFLAEWDGTAWQPLGEPVDGPIQALASRGDDIVVTGAFTKAGQVTSPRIALLTASGWQELADGLEVTALSCLSVSDDGIVAVGGTGGGLAQVWLRRSVKWERLVQTETTPMAALRWRGHDLFVGGNFVRLNGVSSCSIGLWHEPGSVLVAETGSSGEFVLRRTGVRPLGRVIERTDDSGAWSPWISETVLSLRERYVDTGITTAPAGVRLYRERGLP